LNCFPKKNKALIDLRAFKSALSPRLLTLIAFGKIRLAFHFLFPAWNAGLRQSFPRFTSLRQTPIRIDWLTVN
jgi:hypothetical protein